MQIPVQDGTTVLMIEQRDSLAWAMVPELIRRVREFCTKYDSEGDPVAVDATIRTEFVRPTPGVVGFLHLDELGTPIGHLLASVGDWMGTKIVTILQVESDRVTPPLAEAMLDWLSRWGTKNGAKSIHCTTRNEALARLFSKKYGFERGMVLMRRPITVAQEVSQ